MISYSDAGFTFADNSTQASAATPQIQSLGISLASNAVTIASQAYSLAFKTSLTSGATATITGSPTALVIPSTATLGTVSAVASSIIVLVLNNAGTLEYAVVNIAGGTDLSETGVISTTAISAGSTSASVIYSTTARTSVPYRVVGRFDSTQATAGTWATSPSLVQGVGGQALTAMSSLGYGQTWQLVTRTSGTTYYNITGKPITLAITINAAATVDITVNGLIVGRATDNTANTRIFVSAVIPNNASYSNTLTGSTYIVAELR